MIKKQKISICVLVQGRYGHRIISNLKKRGPKNWTIIAHEFPKKLPILIEEPKKFMPQQFPKCDLMLSLGEHPTITTLLPYLAEISGVKAVIAPVDDSNWIPPGIRKQVSVEFRKLGVAFTFPRPFCSLDSNSGDQLIDEFAKKFGIPKLKISLKNGIVNKIDVLRGSPCGATHFVAEKLKGTDRLQAEIKASLFVQTYPCLASRVKDPECGESLIHVAAYIIKRAINKSLTNTKR